MQRVRGWRSGRSFSTVAVFGLLLHISCGGTRPRVIFVLLFRVLQGSNKNGSNVYYGLQEGRAPRNWRAGDGSKTIPPLPTPSFGDCCLGARSRKCFVASSSPPNTCPTKYKSPARCTSSFDGGPERLGRNLACLVRPPPCLPILHTSRRRKWSNVHCSKHAYSTSSFLSSLTG